MLDYSRLLIIYNPNAMKGKIEAYLPKIKERLSLRYSVVDSVFTLLTNTAEDIAFKNASKYDVIVACGGDGTLNQVINGVKKSGSNPIVAILPYGTTNDVSRTLRIPTKLNKAIDTILRLNYIDYDLMYDGNEYTIYTMATGYLTDVSYNTSSKLKRSIGRLAYIFSGLKHIFRLRSFPMTLTIDKERIHDRFIYFMLINGESVGGMRINPKAQLQDHRTYMVLIKARNWFFSVLTFFRMFLFGIRSVKKSKSTIVRHCENIEIENHSNISFTIDGEKRKFLKKSIDVKQSIRIVTR